MTRLSLTSSSPTRMPFWQQCSLFSLTCSGKYHIRSIGNSDTYVAGNDCIRSSNLINCTTKAKWNTGWLEKILRIVAPAWRTRMPNLFKLAIVNVWSDIKLMNTKLQHLTFFLSYNAVLSGFEKILCLKTYVSVQVLCSVQTVAFRKDRLERELAPSDISSSNCDEQLNGGKLSQRQQGSGRSRSVGSQAMGMNVTKTARQSSGGYEARGSKSWPQGASLSWVCGKTWLFITCGL